MAVDLELVLLSRPHVTCRGTPVTSFVYNKSLALLAYLATTGRSHSREELAGLLWGEMPDQSARANLRKVLADLNETLPSHLDITRHAVALNPQSAHWVDIEVFQSRLQSPILETSKTLLDEHELRLLTDAVDVYHDDFLAGFYVHDAPAFEEWVMTQRERFRLLVLRALHRLAKHHTARGAYAAGIEYTTRLLSLEPWHEEFHQQMMLLLALGGQRSAALRQYEICRSLLDQELGVAPSSDTIDLLRQIRVNQLVLPDVPATPPHNLPAQVTPFVGRQAELQAVVERLRDPHCRLLTLVGISGSGKTRLALHAASESLSTFPDGSIFVALNTPDPAGGLLPAILASLGLPPANGQDALTSLLDFLRHKRALLILDGMEHLLDSGELLAQLLHGAPGIKLLATSLERLVLAGEWVLPVRGLDVPDGEQADEATRYGAIQLFVDSARRVRAGFVPSEADVEAICRLGQLVEGLPLALDLAASWVQALTVQEIAQEVATDLDFLTTASRDMPARHRSLCAALVYSLQHLSQEEQSVFRRLSVFEDGFSREAAQQVAEASLPSLAKMVDCCLLERKSPGRYVMHRVMRQYAVGRLAEDLAEQFATRARHCSYYLTCLQECWRQWRMGRERKALDEIASDLANIEAAWTWAVRQSWHEGLDPFASALAGLLAPAAQPGEEMPAWRNVARRVDALLAARGPDQGSIIHSLRATN